MPSREVGPGTALRRGDARDDGAAVIPRAELVDVTLARGGRPVLRGVSLRVPAGGVTAVVGPSGAGKSSLLRCLVRLAEPSAGTVRIDGRDVREQDPCELRRRVGLVAQAPVMLEGTVRENLAYGIEAPQEDGLRDAAARAGLPEGFLDRTATAISGGEAMRVAIARALTRHPDLLLLDEPTAALDADTAAALELSLAGLAATGTTILAVTHDDGFARRLASHVIRLVDGEVAAAGAVADVLR